MLNKASHLTGVCVCVCVCVQTVECGNAPVNSRVVPDLTFKSGQCQIWPNLGTQVQLEPKMDPNLRRTYFWITE